MIIFEIILMLFIGIIIGDRLNKNNITSIDNFALNIAKEIIFKNLNSFNLLIHPVKNENFNKAKTPEVFYNRKVIRVIDGDTIEIENKEKVRYIGIDAPETVDQRKPIQCFGKEAFNKNKELVEGKITRLEKDITDKDKYNRLLRYVWVKDVFVNLELVKQGFAYSYSYPSDIKYQDLFIKAQQEAMKAKRGLWGSCY
ncbi:MAG: thermonuclease family protein [Patescibacteria group bacterium]